jgi:hypothetical protein
LANLSLSTQNDQPHRIKRAMNLIPQNLQSKQQIKSDFRTSVCDMCYTLC